MAAVGSAVGAASAAMGESLVALHAQPLDAPEVVALAASAPRKKRGRPPRVRDETDAAGAAPPPKRKYTKRPPPPVVAPTKRFVRKYTFIKRKPAAPPPPPRKRGKLFPRFPPEVVGAGTRWRMPPQEQLLKPLPKPVAEYLSITRPEEYKAYCAARLAEMRRRREVGERERRIARWVNNGTELPAYMLREPPAPLPLAEVERPEPAIAEKVEKPLVRVYKSECRCGACLRVRFERVQPHAEYVCRMERCRLKFRDLVAFVEHQVDAHATVNVHCKRTRLEFFRAQIDPVFPPETVYIASQYTNATTPPEPWTLARVEQEKEMLGERLAALRYDETFRPVPKRFVRQSFEVAYERVQLYGLAELREQHRIALEHYEAALVFPVGPRNRQDVISSVRLGRNWLRSPEPENSELARVLKIPPRSKDEESGDEEEEEDDEEEEEEVVLFQFGGDDAVRNLSKNKKNDAIVVDTSEIGTDKADKQPARAEIEKVHDSHLGTDAPEMICV